MRNDVFNKLGTFILAAAAVEIDLNGIVAAELGSIDRRHHRRTADVAAGYGGIVSKFCKDLIRRNSGKFFQRFHKDQLTGHESAVTLFDTGILFECSGIKIHFGVNAVDQRAAGN